MSDPFKILIDRLKGGNTQKLEETLDPAFLGPDEPELRFVSKAKVTGEAYVTDSHLIIHLKAHVKISMPCAVCNQMIEKDLKVDNYYQAEPLEEIRGAIYDYSESLREALMIEIPRTVECNNGKCPERATIEPYLRAKNRTEKTTHFPFADMDDLK